MITRFFYAMLFIGMMAVLPVVGFSTEAQAESTPEMEEVKGKIVEINVEANTIRLEPGTVKRG